MYGNPALALLLTFAFFGVLLGLGVLGVLAVGFGARGRRWALVGLGMVLIAVPVGFLVALTRPPPRVDVQLDLARGHQTSQLQGTPNGGLYIYEGDVRLDLKLPGGRSYVGPATLVTCDFEGEEITEVDISLPPGDLATVKQQADGVIANWGLERHGLDQWTGRAGDVFETGSQDDQQPRRSLSIRSGGDNRWTVLLQVSWPRP